MKALGTRTATRSSRRRRGGTAAVELALTLPLLMLIMLGACDFGRFGHTYTAVVNAARAGAGYGAHYRPTPLTQSHWEAAIRRVVADELAGVPSFDDDLLTVNSTSEFDANGIQRVRVEVTYQFTTLINWGTIPHELNLQQTTVFPML